MYVLSLARCRLEWQGKDTHDATTGKKEAARKRRSKRWKFESNLLTLALTHTTPRKTPRAVSSSWPHCFAFAFPPRQRLQV
jgi:hypothetical protein